jgi:hypothetical protein
MRWRLAVLVALLLTLGTVLVVTGSAPATLPVKASALVISENGALGTGFVINEAGCVVTAAHVVAHGTEFLVDSPGNIPYLQYDIIAVGEKHLDVAVLCPLKDRVSPKKIVTFSKEKVTTGEEISLSGYYVNNGHLVDHTGRVIDFVSFKSDPYTYHNAPRFALTEGEFVRTGFSGSAVTSSRGVIGLLAVCFHANGPEQLWLCGGPDGQDIQAFLHRHGIKFRTE